MAIILVIGVSVVVLRFDISKNPTTIVAYRPNVSGASYQSGKPIDIYSLAVYMVVAAVGGVYLATRLYPIRRSVAVFSLSSTLFLLILAVIVANSLISLQ